MDRVSTEYTKKLVREGYISDLSIIVVLIELEIEKEILKDNELIGKIIKY